jgi:cytochrome c-type biogenesis protein CcmH/NrfG
MSPLGKRIVVFFMLWVFLVMIIIQVYDNVSGKGMPARRAPTAAPQARATAVEPDAGVAKLAELQGCLQRDPNNLDCTLDLAAFYFAGQQWAQSQVTYERAVKLQPDNVEALMRLASTYIYQVEFERAAATLAQAATLRPDSPEIHLLYGLALSRLDPPRRAEALVEWRKVIELAPGSDLADQAKALIEENSP